ncbi:MAG: porin [Bdellovibrionales bacterium]|nr:porin [Bdellovibrionales bacterium]
MINKLVVALSTLALSATAVAETDGFKLSGDFAASAFHTSAKNNASSTAQPGFGTGAIGLGAASGNASASNSGDFSVDMAELNLEKGMGDTTIVMGLGFGRVFDRINSSLDSNGDIKSTLNLTNAYLAHKFGDSGFSARVGKFESFLGYETYNYSENMNYTHGHAFNFTMPWYMTGLNVNYAMNMFDFGVYAVNTTANIDADENSNKHLGASVGVTPIEGLKVKLNYLSGHDGGTGFAIAATEQSTQTMNGIVSYSFNNMLDVAFQYVNKSMEPTTGGTETEISSMALYAGYKMEMWGIGARYEMLDDKDGMAFGAASVDNKVNSITVTGWYNFDQNASVKLEYASHSSDKAIFNDDNGAADDKLSSYGVGVSYRF